MGSEGEIWGLGGRFSGSEGDFRVLRVKFGVLRANFRVSGGFPVIIHEISEDFQLIRCEVDPFGPREDLLVITLRFPTGYCMIYVYFSFVFLINQLYERPAGHGATTRWTETATCYLGGFLRDTLTLLTTDPFPWYTPSHLMRGNQQETPYK